MLFSFDTGSTTSPRAIPDVVQAMNITPVAESLLAEHKLQQLAQHPPSFWWRHRRGLRLCVRLAPSVGAIIGGAGLGVVAGQLAFHAPLTSVLLPGLGSLAVLLLAFAIGLDQGASIILRGPARWREYRVSAERLDRMRVPAAIVSLADDILAAHPRADLMYGELSRNGVVLDPYLAIEDKHGRAILGIWQDGRILAMADRNVETKS